MRIPPVLLLAATLAFTACDTESLYSSAYCRLYFDNSTHNDATLAGAMTPYGGIFTTITASNSTFTFTNNQGAQSTCNMTAVEQQRGFSLGYNNAIIVGYGSGADGVFYCYDRECPNCFDPDAMPIRSKPISVNEFGIGSCSVCSRKYDLNNGGIVSDGDAGTKLTRYHATTTGPYGILSI